MHKLRDVAELRVTEAELLDLLRRELVAVVATATLAKPGRRQQPFSNQRTTSAPVLANLVEPQGRGAEANEAAARQVEGVADPVARAGVGRQVRPGGDDGTDVAEAGERGARQVSDRVG